MKISELIEILKEQKDKEGDLEVWVSDGYVLGKGVCITIQYTEYNQKIIVIR